MNFIFFALQTGIIVLGISASEGPMAGAFVLIVGLLLSVLIIKALEHYDI